MGQGLSRLFSQLDQNKDTRIDKREWGRFGRNPKNKRIIKAAKTKPSNNQNRAEINRRNALFRMFPGIDPPCDTACQRQKKSRELKEILEEKKTNIVR